MRLDGGGVALEIWPAVLRDHLGYGETSGLVRMSYYFFFALEDLLKTADRSNEGYTSSPSVLRRCKKFCRGVTKRVLRSVCVSGKRTGAFFYFSCLDDAFGLVFFALGRRLLSAEASGSRAGKHCWNLM